MSADVYIKIVALFLFVVGASSVALAVFTMLK